MLTQIDNQQYDNLVQTINTKAHTSGIKTLAELKTAVENISDDDPLVPPTSDQNYLYFQAEEDEVEISFTCPNGQYITEGYTYNVQFEISTDGTTWTNWSSSIRNIAYTSSNTNYTTQVKKFDTITLSDRGDYVFIRGDNGVISHYDEYILNISEIHISHFITSKKVACGGNIMSLFYTTNLSDRTTLGYYQKLESLFNGTTITTPPTLPATTISNNCYANMFTNCYYLKTVPSLPATNLGTYCYRGMFSKCMSLETVPSDLLPATTLSNYCYNDMFICCYGLKNVPNLPSTQLSEGCYQNMFSSCTSLTSVSSNLLPATTLSNYCYCGMFDYCTSLTNAPIVYINTVGTYSCSNMFTKCSSITSAEIHLNIAPSTDMLSCMFYDCNNLNSVTINTTTVSTISFNQNEWLNYVKANGTIYRPSNITFASNTPNGVPYTWSQEVNS